jgi:hypothetical protein
VEFPFSYSDRWWFFFFFFFFFFRSMASSGSKGDVGLMAAQVEALDAI